MSSPKHEDNGWKEYRGFFQIQKGYPITYAKLLSLKNNLLTCPRNWEAICRYNLEIIEKLIDENEPRALEEETFNICKDDLKHTTSIEECRTTIYSTRINRIMTEINRINRLFTRMGKDSI